VSDTESKPHAFVPNRKFCNDLAIKIESGAPFIWVTTPDIESAMANINLVGDDIDHQRIVWNMADGFGSPPERVFSSSVDLKDELVRVTAELKCTNSDPQLKQHARLFEAITKMEIRKPDGSGKMSPSSPQVDSIFVLVDFDLFAGMLPDYGHLLNLIVNNDMTGEIRGGGESFSRVILFLSATSTPKELVRLKDFARVVEFGLPSTEEARQMVDFCLDHTRSVVPAAEGYEKSVVESGISKLDDEVRNAIALACNGLTRQQTVDLVSEAIASAADQGDKLLDIIHADQEDRMAGRKPGYTQIAGVRVLDRCLRTAAEDLTGPEMTELGAIVRRHLRAFTPEGMRYKLPRRAGCIITGPPGTGKTDFARAVGGIAKEMCGDHFPVIDWEFDAMFGGIVGASENNSRQFWDRINEISPCVVILDEAEKMFAGMASGYTGDGGVGMRLFRQLIGNIEDGKRRPTSPYIILTMNRPDFLRNRALELFSRFAGSTFYIELPGPDARIAIIKKHLGSWLAAQSEPAPSLDEILPPCDYDKIALETEGYSGRDLVAALNEAKELGNPWPNRSLIFDGIFSVKSSISKPEELDAIRSAVSFARHLGGDSDDKSKRIATIADQAERPVVKRRVPTARSN